MRLVGLMTERGGRDTGGRRRAHSGKRLLAAAIAVAAAAGAVPGRAPVARAQTPLPPNILIILTDDQRRPGTLEVMPATRRIFRRGGTDFVNAFSTTPLCCPARASIFTGQYAHNHQVRTNGDGENLDQQATMQRYLQERNYRTAIFGKYMLGSPITAPPPHFDEWAIFRRSTYSYRGGEWNVNGQVRTIDRYSTRYIADKAAGFVAGTEELDIQPWMMFLSTAAPHKPYLAENRYRDAPLPRWRPTPAMNENNLDDKPPYFRAYAGPRTGRQTRDAQLRTLMSVDDMIEKVFDTLRATGEERDTLAIYISDNGFLWGEHRLVHKKFPYLPSVEIPLLMRWPGRVTAGARDRRLAANIDLLPTVLEAALISPDEEHPIDGRSLLAEGSRDRLLLEYWQERALPSWASTITRDYQYIEYYDSNGNFLFPEYYDLANDPWQLHNRFGDREPSNDPDDGPLSEQLSLDRNCVGSSCP